MCAKNADEIADGCSHITCTKFFSLSDVIIYKLLIIQQVKEAQFLYKTVYKLQFFMKPSNF
jgi:hypothetical protein